MREDSSNVQELMSINVGDERLRSKEKLLLIGSCMDRFPDIINEFAQRDSGYPILHVCLEETHVNQAGFKIASIVRYADIKEITVLTVDGSPHCVQLHYIIQDIRRHFTPELHTRHFVVEKGKVHEISQDAVKRSRHLSKIQKMMG
ncbi:4Fe-4S ferredoxin [Candidatus Thorarchaeota archaeon]|nr:MAG: 4Fe-4S ferredoxin [Candidatus Thorarchaeota archaeon]